MISWICPIQDFDGSVQTCDASHLIYHRFVLSHRYIMCRGSFQPQNHDDVIKWKYFPRYWPFARGIHQTPVNSPHKSQWRGALMFVFFICAWINGWVNNLKAGDLRRHHAYYDVTVMHIQCGLTLYLFIYIKTRTTWSIWLIYSHPIPIKSTE